MGEAVAVGVAVAVAVGVAVWATAAPPVSEAASSAAPAAMPRRRKKRSACIGPPDLPFRPRDDATTPTVTLRGVRCDGSFVPVLLQLGVGAAGPRDGHHVRARLFHLRRRQLPVDALGAGAGGKPGAVVQHADPAAQWRPA